MIQADMRVSRLILIFSTAEKNVNAVIFSATYASLIKMHFFERKTSTISLLIHP